MSGNDLCLGTRDRIIPILLQSLVRFKAADARPYRYHISEINDPQAENIYQIAKMQLCAAHGFSSVDIHAVFSWVVQDMRVSLTRDRAMM